MGSVGDKFYIILKGSVDILAKIKKANPESNDENKPTILDANHEYIEYSDLT